VTGAMATYNLFVDVGPLIAQRRFWIESGGFDESWGPLGQTGIISDWEMAVRAWAAGERVSPCAPLCWCHKRPIS